MAIARTQKDSLVDLKIIDKKEEVLKNKPSSEPGNKTKTKPERKPGFFATTVYELRKVEWPNFTYVIRWSINITIFTIVLAVFLGYFDHVFGAGIKFANCTSPLGDNQSVQSCSQDLFQTVTFR